MSVDLHCNYIGVILTLHWERKKFIKTVRVDDIDDDNNHHPDHGNNDDKKCHNVCIG